jgi:hypothetical protein
MNILKEIYKFFDKLEDRVRGKLTHFPLIYAFIGSVGIVSIWRGIWHISDDLGMSGFTSLFLGLIVTMLTGLFVSFFIGENIIISGLNKEKRTDEKTEEEIHKERTMLVEMENDIKKIEEIVSKK